MITAIVIPPSDTRPYVIEIDDHDGMLKMLQHLVGGYIESAPLRDEGTLYINEEGKTCGPGGEPLPTNLIAESLCSLLPGDFIAGPAVLLGPPDDVGNDTSVDLVKYLYLVR